MVKIDIAQFKPLRVQTNAVVIKSGASLKREWPLVCKQVETTAGGPPVNFVLIRTREPWLTQAVTGIAYRGEMCEGVLTELRKPISAEEHRLRTGAPPAPSPGDDENEANDPMDDMEVEDDASDQNKKKLKMSRQRRFPFEKQAFTVFVREVHPEITRGLSLIHI